MNNKIKELREEKGLSQQDLADRAHTSFQQISKLEKGERTLTPAWAKRLAKALDTEPIQVAPELADVLQAGYSQKTIKLAKKLSEMEDKSQAAYEKIEKLIQDFEDKE